jgi:transporter family-2 protein
MTWIAPKFGVGNAVAFVLLGQIISMAIIDHFSLLGAAYHPISGQRFVGIALMAIGVFMSVRG